jgi:hypothetical protein
MKYNIGDLFIRERPVNHQTKIAYVLKEEDIICRYYLNFIFDDGTTDQRFYIPEGIEQLLDTGWKHYPVVE